MKKKKILDKVEREYLKAIVKPFRNKIRWIKLIETQRGCYIQIVLRGECINFPYFETGTMYKGMKTGRSYTLEELGL